MTAVGNIMYVLDQEIQERKDIPAAFTDLGIMDQPDGGAICTKHCTKFRWNPSGSFWHMLPAKYIHWEQPHYIRSVLPQLMSHWPWGQYLFPLRKITIKTELPAFSFPSLSWQTLRHLRFRVDTDVETPDTRHSAERAAYISFHLGSFGLIQSFLIGKRYWICLKRKGNISWN